MQKVFVLLRCWYEGDSYLVDDSFEKVGTDVQGLVAYAKEKYPDCTVFMPGEDVPDDGGYADTRQRLRIIETGVLTPG